MNTEATQLGCGTKCGTTIVDGDYAIATPAADKKAGGSTTADGRVAVFVPPRMIENRQDCITQAAYLIAMRRGFAPGHELDDWLAAESQVDQRRAGEGRAY